MRVMGVDTATSVCSVGITSESGFEFDYRINHKNIHGEYLSGIIREVLNAFRITLSDIDGFAVSIGPGSFTGLRIGLGVVKGIVLAGKKPVAAVPTMDGLIHRVPPLAKKSCVMLMARKTEVYQGKYHYTDGKWKREGEYQIINEKDIGKDFTEEETIFIGEGINKFSFLILKRVKRPQFIQEDFSFPSGFSIAQLGREMIIKGEEIDIETMVPLYLKRFKGIM